MFIRKGQKLMRASSRIILSPYRITFRNISSYNQSCERLITLFHYSVNIGQIINKEIGWLPPNQSPMNKGVITFNIKNVATLDHGKLWYMCRLDVIFEYNICKSKEGAPKFQCPLCMLYISKSALRVIVFEIFLNNISIKSEVTTQIAECETQYIRGAAFLSLISQTQISIPDIGIKKSNYNTTLYETRYSCSLPY
ncbi:hypothetical protein FF38_13841 [Lucilia cuprina]|uniref:Uncharacterized protein n=1 Tax=Lucilia cuprina TaxID=7375 RepID=A0A0L0C494_LUCCU|nr:hypothetical protein FF38_13841 [Lucilia cuprina]